MTEVDTATQDKGGQNAVVNEAEVQKANEGAANGAANGADKANGAGSEGGAAKTVAAGAETETKDQKAYWPDDWRQKVAEYIGAGDEKAVKRELKRLERFSDPTGIYASSRELEAKFSSGGLIKKPGKDAKPEEVAEYHKSIGVPEKVDDYFKDLKLDNGAVLGDTDMPVAKSFAEAMHKTGAPSETVKAALNWYYSNIEEQAANLDEADEKFRIESTQALKEEFGPSFKRQTNAIASLFSTAPGGADVNNEGSLFARIMGGRTSDGRIIGNDPDMVRWLTAIAQDVNPAAMVVEDGDQSGQSVENEIASIEKRMREDKRAYFKDEKAQARYRELLAARDKIQARKT